MGKREGKWLAGILCLVPFVTGLAAEPAADPATVDGVWVRHEHLFTYVGFTSHYSCDGLEGKLKYLLRLSGAREDMVVSAACTEPRGGPSRIASARLAYYTLALPGSPQASAKPDAKNLAHAAKLVANEPPAPGVGQWKSVELRAAPGRDLEEGDCELVEQFDRELLPDFTTRNHESHFGCVPHQLSLNGIRSRYEVLAPLPKAAKAKGAG